MNVLIDINNVVIAKGDITDLGDNNFEVDNCLYGSHLNLTLVETTLLDEDIQTQRDKVINDEKVANALYVEQQVARDAVISQLIAEGWTAP